jgi:predicted nucleic acid-binding protein
LAPAIAWKAAENDRELRRRGITVRKSIDGIIATPCMEANLPLLFSDRDFAGFTDLLALGRIAPPWQD